MYDTPTQGLRSWMVECVAAPWSRRGLRESVIVSLADWQQGPRCRNMVQSQSTYNAGLPPIYLVVSRENDDAIEVQGVPDGAGFPLLVVQTPQPSRTGIERFDPCCVTLAHHLLLVAHRTPQCSLLGIVRKGFGGVWKIDSQINQTNAGGVAMPIRGKALG
jgi:hypothetical protein